MNKRLLLCAAATVTFVIMVAVYSVCDEQISYFILKQWGFDKGIVPFSGYRHNIVGIAMPTPGD